MAESERDKHWLYCRLVGSSVTIRVTCLQEGQTYNTYGSGFCVYAGADYAILFTSSHIFPVGPYETDRNFDTMSYGLRIDISFLTYKFEAKLIVCSNEFDFAMLKVQAHERLRPLMFRQENVTIGMSVFSVSSPSMDVEDDLLYEPQNLSGTFSVGFVQFTIRHIQKDPYHRSDYIQYYLGGCAKGSSGAAVVDRRGRVVAINSSFSNGKANLFGLDLNSLKSVLLDNFNISEEEKQESLQIIVDRVVRGLDRISNPLSGPATIDKPSSSKSGSGRSQATEKMTLRKEHTMLSNAVKDLTSNSYAGFEALNTLQHPSAKHELLKKKHLEESDLLKKYIEEYSGRKKLYNEVIELKGNIRVFCRCRPLNQDEMANGATSVVEIAPSRKNELHIVCADSSKKKFKFDHVFGPHATQEEVFRQTSPIVTSVLDGYNACILAYGQTGTGKTFIMEGTSEKRGVNYKIVEELFRIAAQRSVTMRYELFVSMLEVYNERIRDLLVENSSEPTKKLAVKQGLEGTQEVRGLVEARVHGTNEVWELLKTGIQVRSIGLTNANELLSRSHCLLRLTVKGENLVNGQRTKSNLWLVDLAGSEHVGRIEVEGERLKESQFINKSLSALGDVISALASQTAHVPYRNSKLTHILQSSLASGDGNTLMFVQISPSATDLGETLCTLNFASRVKGIEYGPARKQADVSELKYKHLVEKLKHDEKETNKLQDNVQSLQLRLDAREQICRSLQEKVRDPENQLAEERKIGLKQESRAVAAASARPKQAQKPATEKKPPLGPSNMKLPLRRISSFMPPRSPVESKEASDFPSFGPNTSEGKENGSYGSNTRALGEARCISIAVRPPSQTLVPTWQPRRRVSVATLRPVCTPLNTQAKRHSALQQPSFSRETSRVRQFSKVFSPLPDARSRTVASSLDEATPMSSCRRKS